MNILGLRAGETLTVKSGGDTAMSGAVIAIVPYDPETGAIDSLDVSYGFVIVTDNKIKYTAVANVAIVLMPVYSDAIGEQNLTTTSNDYLTFEVIENMGTRALSGENEKTLSEASLIGGFTYFVEVNVNNMHTLTSESFYVDYEITHQPTTDEPYVETNNDEDVSSYTWYQIGEELRPYTEIVMPDSECIVNPAGETECDSDGWWSSTSFAHANTFAIGNLDFKAGETVRVETSGDTKVTEVVIADNKTGQIFLALEEGSDGVYEGTLTEDLQATLGVIFERNITANDKHRISITSMKAYDMPLDDETEYELSTGEDGKEYYCVVEFNDETTLISDSFEWETPKKPTNNSGGGLSAGGDTSNKGADKFNNQTTPTTPDITTTPDASGKQTSNKMFDDAPVGSWFTDAAEWMGTNGYMTGTAPRTFSPNLNTTRGMIVTVLWRMAGSPAPSGECPFEDVKPDSYYEDAITWAQENGVVTGHSDTIFAPDDLITREQLATIIFRNEVRKGMEAVTTEENLTAFEDAESISEYAVTAMNWAVGQKIINGVSETKLAPQKTATRAECATMLYRMENK